MDANMQTTLIINNMEFDKSGDVIFLGDSDQSYRKKSDF
jgi:hypothetical protein